MYPSVRDDCGHGIYFAFYSTFKMPELVSLTGLQKPSVQHTELASAGAARAQGSVCVSHMAQGLQGEVMAECARKPCLLLQYRFNVPGPSPEGPLVLLFFSSHSINNSNAHSKAFTQPQVVFLLLQ